MPRLRFERLPPERRLMLLETAAKEFAERGFEGASLNRVLGKVGLSKGSFYYYFDSKADLLAAVVRLIRDQFFAEPRFDFAAIDADNFWPRLRDMARQNRALMLERPWVGGIMRLVYAQSSPPEVVALTSGVADHMRSFLRRLIERGREVGAARADLPVDLVLELVLAMDETVDRWVSSRWKELGEEKVNAIYESYFDIARLGFASTHAATPVKRAARHRKTRSRTSRK